MQPTKMTRCFLMLISNIIATVERKWLVRKTRERWALVHKRILAPMIDPAADILAMTVILHDRGPWPAVFHVTWDEPSL